MANPAQNAVADPGSTTMSDEQRRAAALDHAVRARHRQTLDLQRDYILSQRTSNPSRRAALEAALEQVEAQIHSLE